MDADIRYLVVGKDWGRTPASSPLRVQEQQMEYMYGLVVCVSLIVSNIDPCLFSRLTMSSPAMPPQAPVVVSRAVSLIAVSTVLQALAFTAALLRFSSRSANHSIGRDDWTALVALVL